jgi:hypothetical protein
MGESKRRKLLGTDKIPNGRNNTTPKYERGKGKSVVKIRKYSKHEQYLMDRQVRQVKRDMTEKNIILTDK